MSIVFVAVGGALGASARYFMSFFASECTASLMKTSFWECYMLSGTLLVNAIGSLIIGFVFPWIKITNFTEELRLLTVVGFLGSYTTFSSYSFETLRLIREKHVFLGIVNIILNNGLSLLMVFLGMLIANAIIKP